MRPVGPSLSAFHSIIFSMFSSAAPSLLTTHRFLTAIGTTYHGNMVSGSRSYTRDQHLSSVLLTRSSGIHSDTIFLSFSWSRIGGRVRFVERCTEGWNMSLCFLSFCRTNRILLFQVEHTPIIRSIRSNAPVDGHMRRKHVELRIRQ